MVSKTTVVSHSYSIHVFLVFSFADKPKTSLPGGQFCNYICDNKSGEDFSTNDKRQRKGANVENSVMV